MIDDIVCDDWIDQAVLLYDNIYEPIHKYIIKNEDRLPQDVLFNNVMTAIGRVSIRFNAGTKVSIAHEAISKQHTLESVLLAPYADVGDNKHIHFNIHITVHNENIGNDKIPTEEKFTISYTGAIDACC